MGFRSRSEVDRDEACFLNHIPRDNADGAGCNVNGNRTLNVGGSGVFGLGGVVYAPSDNIQVNGGSNTVNFVGQIVSWSTTYTGGATLSQSYPGQKVRAF